MVIGSAPTCPSWRAWRMPLSRPGWSARAPSSCSRTTPPRGRPGAEPHEGLDQFRLRLRTWRIDLFVHASYLVNLATPDAVVLDRSIARMGHELDAARGFGATALNVHIGSHKGSGPEAGIERVGVALARILDARPLDDADPRLVLEDSAGQGGGVGVTLEELGAIMDAAARHGADRSRLGICLDTAHLWGAGYALDDPVAIDGLLASADALLGPDGLAMIHLNDSRVRRGSRFDRHEHIGAGAIGGAGLGHLLRHPRLASMPMILETPGMDTGWDAVNMARVRDLARRCTAGGAAGGCLPGTRQPDLRAPAGHQVATGWCARALRPVRTARQRATPDHPYPLHHSARTNRYLSPISGTTRGRDDGQAVTPMHGSRRRIVPIRREASCQPETHERPER